MCHISVSYPVYKLIQIFAYLSSILIFPAKLSKDSVLSKTTPTGFDEFNPWMYSSISSTVENPSASCLLSFISFITSVVLGAYALKQRNIEKYEIRDIRTIGIFVYHHVIHFCNRHKKFNSKKWTKIRYVSSFYSNCTGTTFKSIPWKNSRRIVENLNNFRFFEKPRITIIPREK